MSKFTEILTVSPLADGRTWVTRKEFGYDVGAEGSGNSVEVPIGFMTDFASVPIIIWSFLPPWGKYGNAAVIHDYLYWEQNRTREESDKIFREAMVVLSVSNLTSSIMYYAVKWFGFGAWSGNRKTREKGVNRVMESLPIKSIEVPSKGSKK